MGMCRPRVTRSASLPPRIVALPMPPGMGYQKPGFGHLTAHRLRQPVVILEPQQCVADQRHAGQVEFLRQRLTQRARIHRQAGTRGCHDTDL